MAGESKLSGVTLTGRLERADCVPLGQLQLAAASWIAQFVADLAKASDIRGTLSVPRRHAVRK